jgi:hypothetical protein|tara:strand:+ start:1031 stop:1381 length:351 start_codon:yes stop_codon:yes gene_type:complete
MSLNEWFGKGSKGDWVDIGAPKPGGGFEKCGRKSTKNSSRAYPKCVPASKASKMTPAQRKSAVARKRSKPQGVGGKPTNVKTFAASGGLMVSPVVKKYNRGCGAIMSNRRKKTRYT